MRQVWLLVNAAAGDHGAATRARRARAALESAGIATRLVEPTSREAMAAAAADAVATDPVAVVACGGDGTVHVVARALLGGSVPLGVIPSGSGDDFARAVGIPVGDDGSAVDHLLAAVRSGVGHAVDVGVVTTSEGVEHPFLAVLSTGFDAAVNERANAMPRMGRARYVAALVRELVTYRAVPYVLTCDDVTVEGKAMLVSIGNGSTYGGGMRICPDAVPHDGVLDVTWVDEVARTRLLRLFPSVYSGTHVRLAEVRTLRGREITVDAPGQVAYADGERLGTLPVRVAVSAAALTVVGPSSP